MPGCVSCPGPSQFHRLASLKQAMAVTAGDLCQTARFQGHRIRIPGECNCFDVIPCARTRFQSPNQPCKDPTRSPWSGSPQPILAPSPPSSRPVRCSVPPPRWPVPPENAAQQEPLIERALELLPPDLIMGRYRRLMRARETQNRVIG